MSDNKKKVYANKEMISAVPSRTEIGVSLIINKTKKNLSLLDRASS